MFCPNPPKINVRELDEYLDQYINLHDGLELKNIFISTDESDIKEVIDIPRFVKISNWTPKPSKNTRLESIIDQTQC